MRWSWVALLFLACAAPTRGLLVSPLQLPPARVTTKSELVLRCTPEDAEVSLDGVTQGTCADFNGEPRTLGLGRGLRHVRVWKRGFTAWDSVMEADNTRMAVTVTLLPSGGDAP
jgi:hypothetical protein